MNREQKILLGVLCVAFVLSSAAPIFSQQPQPAPEVMVIQRTKVQEPEGAPKPPPGDVMIVRREKLIQGLGDAAPHPGDETFFYVSSEMSFDGKTVKGAPYSAQAVTEMTQTLSDGNRIVNKSTASLYRDGEGRTRREQTLRVLGPFATAGEPPQTIFINDPVAEMSYMLDARTHVARKMPSFHFEVRVKAPVDGVGPSATAERSAPAMPDPRWDNGNVYVMTAPVPGGEGYRVEFHGGGKRAKEESLGKQTVEGVEAEGTRTTVTIPAGEIGNERAIEIINERWYSPELQTVVMTKRSDPRVGETVYRLTNIDRSEPAKSLFEIPADYTIKSMDKPGGLLSKPGGLMSAIDSSTGEHERTRAINGGVLNGKATSLPAPEYPAIARQAHASGAVKVEITVDEEGNVTAARAVAGHPLLQAAAVTAARQAKFSPTKLEGQAVKIQGILVYNFAAQE